MTTIVTEFGKFRYNNLPMGMCSSGDIFQAKVGKLLIGTEVFKENTADISKFILSVKGSYCL